MSGQSGDSNSEHPNVLSYRVGQVELDLRDLLSKVENFVQLYPTVSTINLIIEPIKQDVVELKAKNEAEANAKTAQSAQLKLAIFVAAISPVFSLVLTLMLTGKIGG